MNGVIKAKIYRFDPDNDKEPYYQNYEIPVDREVTVHELLSIIREKLSRKGQVVHVGMTVTCARTINKREEKSILGKYFDALTVDMEDYRRLRIARQLGIKMYCIRAVLDDSEDTIPGPWSGIGPGKLSALLRKISPAQQSIGRMLTAFVPAALKKMEIE